VSSAAGAPFLAELDKAMRLVDRFATSFYDKRDPVCMVHVMTILGAQRRCGLALGYEDATFDWEVKRMASTPRSAIKSRRRRANCKGRASRRLLHALWPSVVFLERRDSQDYHRPLRCRESGTWLIYPLSRLDGTRAGRHWPFFDPGKRSALMALRIGEFGFFPDDAGSPLP
jgi:hypothetical protein